MQADSDAPRFGVLGPIAVSLGGEPLLPRAPLQRRLLAALLAASGRTLSAEALTAAIWEELPPDQGRKALLVCMHRLRRALRDPRRITLEPAGYRIVVTADDCDAAAFDELTATARRHRREAELDRAAAHYTRALALWRGAAYADVADDRLIAPEAERLDEQRLLARQELLEVRLDQGRHAAVGGELERLARAHPFRERLAALRMLALHRDGRRADALQAYRESRRTLRDELGIDPGPLLQRVHEAILRGDRRLATVATAHLEGDWTTPARTEVTTRERPEPRELPADATGFTGREGELRELETARQGDADEGIPPAPVVLIAGMAGVGKTATAVHWAHRIAPAYPDGQLFLDLRGHSTLPALRPAEALAAMLGSLGLSGDQVPADLDRASARLRTATAGRRMLLLLDNAETLDQVAPLLPGGPGTLVIVTSRHRLADLTTRHGARRLDLDPLTADEATGLLKTLLRLPRTAARPDLTDLVRRTGRLPLALRIAAAALTDGTHPAGTAANPHTALKATFDLSYRRLPDEARRVLRLLGTAPARSLAPEAVAAMAQLDVSAAERALEHLVHAHMADRDGRGRIGLHDLIREYAANLVAADPAARSDALKRLFDWYLGATDAACAARYPAYARIPDPERPPAPAALDPARAARWLDDEREHLVAVARYASEHGHGAVAWRLADALRGHAWTAMSAADFLALGRAALNGARADRSPAGTAAAELCMSTAYLKSRDYTDAARHAERAIAHAEPLPWAFGAASAHHNMALACWNLGRLRPALDHGEAALALNRKDDRTRAASVNLGALAVVHGDLGAPLTEQRMLTEALALAEAVDDTGLQASHLRSLASVAIELGALDAAQSFMDRVLAIEADSGAGEGGMATAASLAELASARGGHEDALAYAEAVVGQADHRGDRTSRAIGLVAAATALNGLARHEEAAAAAAQALRTVDAECTGTGLKALTERAAARLGLAESDAESDASAIDAAAADAARLLQLTRDGGYRTDEAAAHGLLAAIAHRRGDPAAARRHRESAASIRTESGTPHPARFERLLD